MGMFDDLIAKHAGGGAAAPASGGGMFDDLVRVHSIDYSGDERTVFQSIEKLPEQDKKSAYDAWAKARVTRERNQGFKPAPSVARGIPLIGPYLDEASAGIQGVLNTVTDGNVGRPYDAALAYNRASEGAAREASPVTAAVGDLAAGIATGGAIVGRLPMAPTLMGRVGQGVGIGGAAGAIEGFGAGEGGLANRVEAAQQGASLGATIGGALPVATSAVGRGYVAAREAFDPTFVRLRSGPEEAADQILASRIAREGSSPAAKRLDLQRGQTEAATLNANSQATLPETLADTSDAMRRLTGSIYRQGGEAGNFVRETLENRQRGTRDMFSRPGGTPDGQAERVMDSTQRALLIRSSNSAYQTEQQIMRQQAQDGRRLYRDAFERQEAFDIQPVLDGFALRAQQYPAPFQSRMTRALNLFRDNSPNRMPVNRLERFDAAKKALDDQIEQAQRAGAGNLVRELTQFKNELIDNVHAGGRNASYQAARDAWGSAAENREAIDLGRQALRENSEVAVEQYRALSSGQQQLFRIGFLDGMRQALRTRKPGDNVTQLFEQQRVRELMSEIIPRSQGRGVFANRPERFGDLIGREQRMVQTRTMALGNSATAQRQADDLQFGGDALSSMWNRFRQSPSLFNMGVEAIGVGIQRMFGYRQDVALALARRLLEQDPTTRNQILRRLQNRQPGRYAEFARMLDDSARALTVATAGPAQIENK